MKCTLVRPVKKRLKRRNKIACPLRRAKCCKKKRKAICPRTKKSSRRRITVPKKTLITRITSMKVVPVIRRYFYTAEQDIHLTEPYTIPADQFLNDEGECAQRFVDFGAEGYYNLYINAVLQEGMVYSVTSQALTIKATGDVIFASTPIIMQAVGLFIVSEEVTSK